MLVRSATLKQLKSLDLSFNELAGVEEAALLLEHRAALSHLERLDLRGNEFGVSAADKLAEALPDALV